MTCECNSNLAAGFEVGAKWADEHPNWHIYPAEKPKFTMCYIVFRNKYSEYLMYDYCYYDECDNFVSQSGYHYDNERVVAWMELPKFD